MEYIDSLQSEPVPEPVMEVEETKVHPLLQAMRELREEGIVESLEIDIEEEIIYQNLVEEEYTFNEPRRQLNIPELIKRGAIYITHPHGPNGWETDRPDWDFSLITLQNIMQKSPDWSVEYKKYIRPESYNKATQEFFDKLSDQKYQQILWSIDKLNIPDNVAFLDKLDEASPDTLEGSFTPDLVESKTWLANMLAKGLKGKNAGTIYVLGSWYGNMGIFLQQAGVNFKKLVLVEPDEEALMRSKELLDTLNDSGKLILIHQKAEDVVYEKPCVVINTSCNETGPVFLTKLPDNVLCCLQARNNNEDSLFPTEHEEDFTDYFPLAKVYYYGEKQLEDPEVNYVRYMKIGRTGKQIDETISTGQGGGSAGVGGGSMVGGPTTYEQEYGMFQRKGPRRITAMTNEETTTLNQLYKNGKPDHNETIWDYGTMIWDNEYEIETINPRKLEMFLCDQYDVEFIEDLFERMSEEQHEIVDNYIKDPNLSNQIIVMDNGFIVDGNHRAIAAALTKRPIKYIDISDEEEL